MMNFPPVFVMALEFSESKLCFFREDGADSLEFTAEPCQKHI